MDAAPAGACLTAPLDRAFFSVVTSFAEQAAQALGLGAGEAMRLTLACEEVFGYLVQIAGDGEMVQVEAAGGGYYVEIQFRFQVSGVDLAGLNLTTSLSPLEEDNLDQLGLLLASRSVDRFSIRKDPPDGQALVLVKEKAYPPVQDMEPPEAKPLESFTVAPAGPEELKIFSSLLAAFYPPEQFPPSFAVPGKLVDMAAAGEYAAAAALGPHGALGGMMAWRWASPRTVRCMGPYLFNQPEDSDMASALVEACLGAIAKSEAVGLLCTYPTNRLPAEFFEELGRLDISSSDGEPLELPMFYRHLKEDHGGRVWAHADLKDFLEREYQRLFLAREISLTQDQGEQRPKHSVFAADIDRTVGLAMLRPLWDGSDAADNLARHLTALSREGAGAILLEMDLAHAWQAALAPDLLANGFEPKLLLPYGGDGDLVIFQHSGAVA